MTHFDYSAEQYEQLISKLNDIGISLSAEKNISRLTERIVDELRSFTNADAGALYILNKTKKSLQFQIVQTESLNIRMGGTSGIAITWSDVMLELNGKENLQNISAYVANTGKTVNIPDVYKADGFDFGQTKVFDKKNNYRTKSTLTLPLIDHNRSVIGVLQLINARDEAGEIIPFKTEFETLVRSLASQAAIALENAKLIADLRNLFKSLVVYSSKAIEARSPHTAGHSGRVATLSKEILKAINRQNDGVFADVYFSPEQIEEIEYAGWLHDIGKIGVPEAVLEKENKLTDDQIDIIRERFLLSSFYNACYDYEDGRRMEWSDFKNSFHHYWKNLLDELKYIQKINELNFAKDHELKRIRELARTYYFDFNGKRHDLLTNFELENLEVRKGNLTEEERKTIQSHVTESYRILKAIPFMEDLDGIPNMVIEHHEYLNGAGYPYGLRGDEITLQGRAICVADVFDALTAKDRPYKKSVPLDRTLEILQNDAESGLFDKNIVDLFVQEKLYFALPGFRKKINKH